MARQTINIGSVANDNTGDNLRVAGDKINDNFSELYNITQSAASAVSFAGTSFDPVTYTGSESITSNALVFCKKAALPFNLNMPDGVADGEIKIFVNTGSTTLTISAVSSNLSTPGGGSTIAIQSNGATMLIWSETDSAWFMLGSDANNSKITT